MIYLLRILLLVTPIVCEADGVSGADVLNRCMIAVAQSGGATVSPSDAALAVWCYGYIGGLADGILAERALASRADLQGFRVCLPDNVRLQQLSLVIVNDLLMKHDLLPGSGGALAVGALARKFPCKP